MSTGYRRRFISSKLIFVTASSDKFPQKGVGGNTLIVRHIQLTQKVTDPLGPDVGIYLLGVLLVLLHHRRKILREVFLVDGKLIGKGAIEDIIHLMGKRNDVSLLAPSHIVPVAHGSLWIVGAMPGVPHHPSEHPQVRPAYELSLLVPQLTQGFNIEFELHLRRNFRSHLRIETVQGID